jgi:CheY-specific phosphatase CheX
MGPIVPLPVPDPESAPAAGARRPDWIDHFAAAALEVLQTELGLEVWRGMACPGYPSQAQGGVRLMVVYGGATLRGMALLAIDDEVAAAIAARLDRQAAWTSQYPVQRGMNQLGTALAWGINRRLRQAGRGVKLSAPAMLVGPEAFEAWPNPQNASQPAGRQVQSWRIALYTPMGDMQLYLAWRQLGSGL